MSRIKKGDTSLRIELNDTDKYKDWSESPYEVISCISDDGINIIISSDIDPNPIDITLPYAAIIEPVTGSITELRDMLRCWILTKSRSAGNDISENGDPYIMIFPDTDQLGTPGCYTVIPNASCPYVLQNSGGTLYFDGLPLGGGGGGITTADNGLTINPAGNVQLGGTLIQDTFIAGLNSFQLAISGLTRFLAIGGEVELTTSTADSTFHMQDGNAVTTTSTNGIINNTDSFLVRSQTVPSEILITQNLISTTIDHNSNITHKVRDNVDPLINGAMVIDNGINVEITLSSNTSTTNASNILGNIRSLTTINDTLTGIGSIDVNPLFILNTVTDINTLNSTEITQNSNSLHLNSGLRLRNTTFQPVGPHLLDDQYNICMLDSTAGIFTMELPAAPIGGTVYTFKDLVGNLTANPVLIDGNGNLIDGIATYSMALNWETLRLICIGSDWFKI